jgi:hypothetical protein
MPLFTLVYYEVTRLEKTVEAESLEQAILIGNQRRHDTGWWEDAQEETLGTNGVEHVFDDHGHEVYPPIGRPFPHTPDTPREPKTARS